jgi:SAM-dependent methyltransferase
MRTQEREMPEFTERMTDLSPAKQQLLRQLLDQGRTKPPPRPPASAKSASTPTAILAHASPGTDTKTACRAFYDTVTEQLNASEFGPFAFFLNYGYVPDLSPQYACVQLPEHMLNKNSVRLVLEVLEDCVVPASRVLDVGCGRGGTLHVLGQFFHPARMVGLDIAAAAIVFASGAHEGSGARFLQGDAERLPFAEASFDVVTNIESSSCYPDPPAFYAEVLRVLTPGGWFLYSDCLPCERFRDAIRLLKDIGFILERDRDITPNVLASCDGIASARVGAYNSAASDAGTLNDFLGAPGSHYYEEMRSRRWTYRICKLRKNAPGSATESAESRS